MLRADPAGSDFTYVVEHVDTDASGIVHFSRYASLMETVALERLERLGFGLDAMNEAGLDLRVSRLDVRYRAAARFRDRLHCAVEIEHVGVASVRMRIDVRGGADDGERVLASGGLVFAFVDGRDAPQPLPEAAAELLRGGCER